MDAVLKTIGTVVLASLMIAVPILLPISFIYNWDGFVKLLLIMATVFVWGVIAISITIYAEME